MTQMELTFSIKEVAEKSGVTPSALRIWELRYGWPAPYRKANGYRYYLQNQIDEITRIASFVRTGVSISTLIEDGLPVWPAQHVEGKKSKAILFTRNLPAPEGKNECELNASLLDALEEHRFREVQHILHRIFWTVRPQDEPRVALIPSLVGISELNLLGRPIPEAGVILDIIRDRCMQLLRMQRVGPDPIAVVPSRGGDDAIAALVAVILCQGGLSARPWMQRGLPSSPFISATEKLILPLRSMHHLGAITLRGEDGSRPLTDLLSPDFTMSNPAGNLVGYPAPAPMLFG